MALHDKNASSLIVVKLELKVIDFNLTQFTKAFSPISSTEFDNVKLTKY